MPVWVGYGSNLEVEVIRRLSSGQYSKRWLAAILFVAMIPACGIEQDQNIPVQSQSQPQAETSLVHVVLVWLKEPGNAEHRQQIIQGTQRLRQIPGVLDLHVGEVISSDRPVVEDSYDVGIYLRFANAEDLQAYLTHPMHVNTVKTQFLPIMERYQVMDFSSQ